MGNIFAEFEYAFNEGYFFAKGKQKDSIAYSHEPSNNYTMKKYFNCKCYRCYVIVEGNRKQFVKSIRNNQ